jgi:hypothetical protein
VKFCVTGEIMIYHLLFWTMCAVLAAHVAVAIIAIAKAYRDEGKLFASRPPFPAGRGKRTAFF